MDENVKHRLKENREEGLKINNPQNASMTSYWERVLYGFFGGALIVGSFWLFFKLQGELKFLALIPFAIGVSAIFYGRYKD